MRDKLINYAFFTIVLILAIWGVQAAVEKANEASMRRYMNAPAKQAAPVRARPKKEAAVR